MKYSETLSVVFDDIQTWQHNVVLDIIPKDPSRRCYQLKMPEFIQSRLIDWVMKEVHQIEAKNDLSDKEKEFKVLAFLSSLNLSDAQVFSWLPDMDLSKENYNDEIQEANENYLIEVTKYEERRQSVIADLRNLWIKLQTILKSAEFPFEATVETIKDSGDVLQYINSISRAVTNADLQHTSGNNDALYQTKELIENIKRIHDHPFMEMHENSYNDQRSVISKLLQKNYLLHTTRSKLKEVASRLRVEIAYFITNPLG